MGGTKKLMIKEIKEILFCLANQIALAAEYLPGTLIPAQTRLLEK